MSRPPIIQRYWAVPGLLDKQLARARHRRLGARRARQLAARQDPGPRREARGRGQRRHDRRCSASASSTSRAYVKPGRRPGAGRRSGSTRSSPTISPRARPQDEVQRAVMSEVSGRIRGLEQVGGFGGKAVTLAEGQTFADDSDFYKKTLASYAAITPAAVRAAMQQWLRRPALTITLSPGERDAYAEAKASQPRRPSAKDDGAVQADRDHPAGRPARSARLPGDRPHQLSERHRGRLCPAHRGSGDPGRAGVRRRRRGRQPARSAASPR